MVTSAFKSISISKAECRRDFERLNVGEGGPGDIDLDFAALAAAPKEKVRS
jgi:hypothetical protein